MRKQYLVWLRNSKGDKIRVEPIFAEDDDQAVKHAIHYAEIQGEEGLEFVELIVITEAEL